MVLKHRKGRFHCNAVALSRVQTDEFCKWFTAESRLEEIPCGGCAFCTKANNQWSFFVQDVDDVVGLACRSVRELEDMDFESEPVGGIVEEPHVIVEVSATCQSVRLRKGDINPVIKEVKADVPPSVWRMLVEEVINVQTKDENLNIIRQWLEGTGFPLRVLFS